MPITFKQECDLFVFTQTKGDTAVVVGLSDEVSTVSAPSSGGQTLAQIQNLIDSAIDLDNVVHDDPDYVPKDFAALPPLP